MGSAELAAGAGQQRSALDPSARLAAGAAKRSACMKRVGAVAAQRQARSPAVGIKLKRQVLPKLYARQAVGAYHSKALLIKCQSR